MNIITGQIWFVRMKKQISTRKQEKKCGRLSSRVRAIFLDIQRSTEDCRFSLTVTQALYGKIQLYKIQSDSDTKINKNLPIYSIEGIVHVVVCNRLCTDRMFYVQKKADDVSCVSPRNSNGTVKCGTDPGCNVPRQNLRPYATDQ